MKTDESRATAGRSRKINSHETENSAVLVPINAAADYGTLPFRHISNYPTAPQAGRPDIVSSQNAPSTTAIDIQADASDGGIGVQKFVKNLGTAKPTAKPGLVTVKRLAALYGVSASSVYSLIKTDPSFPWLNVGLKKRYMVDVMKFEKWLEERNKKERSEIFDLPSATELLKRYKR